MATLKNVQENQSGQAQQVVSMDFNSFNGGGELKSNTISSD